MTFSSFTRWSASATFALAAASLSLGTHAAELVTNGGFETGNFNGWTVSGTVDANTFSVDGYGPHNGNFSAFFGEAAPTYDTISQTLGTVAGQRYLISFMLDSEYTSFGSASFIGKFGNTTFLSLNNTNADFTFKAFSFNVVATSASTVLSFAGYNGGYYYTLDDVSVMAAPVPEAPSAVLIALGLASLSVAARRRALNG